MTARTGISKGLDALFLELKESNNSHAFLEKEGREVKSRLSKLLPIDAIYPSKLQPRKDFNPDELKELVDSIKTQGILQPIIVRPQANESFEIVAGERRWRAARLAELTHIPAVVHVLEDTEVIVVALVENVQRSDLNPLEEAVAMQRLAEETGYTHEKVASLLGKSRVSVTNLIRLLSLEPEVKNLLLTGQLDMGHARVLVGIEGAEQIKLALAAVNNKLNVRQVEAFGNQLKEKNKQVLTQSWIPPDKINVWKNDLTKEFHAGVNIRVTNNGTGSVTFRFDSLSEMEWFISNARIEKTKE